MCGIAGYAGRSPLNEERLESTLALMRHRGPDDQSRRAFRTPDGRYVELLHARLSIIDLDPRSNQPFQVGPKWMAYNGELYNYVEVRRELESRGVSLRTASDTEVLLAALAHEFDLFRERCGFAGNRIRRRNCDVAPLGEVTTLQWEVHVHN